MAGPVAIVEPVMKYCAILGLVPWHLKGRRVKFQKYYSVALIFVNLINFVYGIVLILEVDAVIVAKSVSVILLLVHRILVVVCLVETPLICDTYYQFLVQADYMMRFVRRELKWGMTRKMLWAPHRRRDILFQIIVFTGIVTQVVVSTRMSSMTFLWSLMPGSLILRLRALQIIRHIDFINFYLEILHQKLCSIVNAKVHGRCDFLDVDYSTMSSLSCLTKLTELFSQIRQLTDLFHQLFGWSTLCLLAVVTVELILNLYWICMIFDGVYPIYNIFFTIGSLATGVTIIAVLCYICEKCKRTNDEMARMVHRLVQLQTNAFQLGTHNALVSGFGLQIRQSHIEIVVAGLFTIDFRLVMQIFGITILNLFVLLQFNNTRFNAH